MVVFLSFAEEDAQAGNQIAELLSDQGIAVYNWLDPEGRSGRFIRTMEEELARADAFLALLSPASLTSPWCRMEREFAMLRELDLEARGRVEAGVRPKFVYVASVAAVPYLSAGFLGTYDWINLSDPDTMRRELQQLARKLSLGTRSRPASSAGAEQSPPSPFFRNRRDELDKVLRGLLNAAGPHFWLVSAPPALGKTWFLDRLNVEILATEGSNWVTRLVDLRDLSPDARGDARAILAALLPLDPHAEMNEETLRDLAQEISSSERPHLCLVDSAELMADEVVDALRLWFGEIYGLLQNAGNIDVRLAVVVASRRGDLWRGVTPHPRFSPLPLTEFNVTVVQEALQDLAREMGRTFANSQFQHHAARVHRLSEGLPALLVRCLRWIRKVQWIDIERLDDQRFFEELANPYIQRGLLAEDSLFRSREERPEAAGRALILALRAMVRYRLFTQAHLRPHLDADQELRHELDYLKWAMEDLWEAISGTALLRQPLDEVWQEFHRPIRRVLYRYFFTSDGERARIHDDARAFVQGWAERQDGKDMAVGRVECLWHQAEALRLGSRAEPTEKLCESARELGAALQNYSGEYGPSELQGYAARRIRDDEELQESVNHVKGLGERLAKMVTDPDGGS